MAMKITLPLHKEGNALVLNSQDVYKYLKEDDYKEIELAYYIDKYCEYLNYYIYNNKELAFGDPFIAKLEGWLAGYECAKKAEVTNNKDVIEIKMRGYHIILNKPFEI